MDQNQEIYADGIGEISLSGGMVRMDLVSLVGSQQDQDNKPLIDAGLVRPREGGDAAGSANPVRSNPPKSPNF
jgi:hypothetical protein